MVLMEQLDFEEATSHRIACGCFKRAYFISTDHLHFILFSSTLNLHLFLPYLIEQPIMDLLRVSVDCDE